MPNPVDLTNVIEDAISDAALPADNDTQIEDSQPEPLEATPEASDAPEQPDQDSGDTRVRDEHGRFVAQPSDSKPETKPAEVPKPEDDFDKKFGLTAESMPGRENRIPYSRVKKIVEKAVKDKEAELSGSYSPKVSEYETKIKDYEAKFHQVTQFEDIMVNDADRFLQMLYTIPAYQPFFAALKEAVDFKEAQAKGTLPQAAQTQAPVNPADEMPAPDETLADGTKVYSIEGLKGLLNWNADQAEKKATKAFETKYQQLEDRYKPIESEWRSREYMRTVMPKVQAQIEQAKKWPLFNENEAEITRSLASDQNLSLEGAYQKVVWPKMMTDRNKMREELLAEIKSAPVSTSVPVRQTKPVPQISNRPRDLEDVIREQIASLK